MKQIVNDKSNGLQYYENKLCSTPIIDHFQELKDKIKKDNEELSSLVQNISEIVQKSMGQELALLKENNELFDGIFYKLIDSFQLQNKNLDLVHEIIKMNDDFTEKQLDWIERDIKDIKDYINLPWYKKLFMKLF